MVKFWQVSKITLKSSCRRCFIKKAVLKNLGILIGKHLCWESLFNKFVGFSCEFYETFKNISFKWHLWTTASELYWFKVEDIKIEKNRDVFRDDNRRRIQNLVKHVRWSFFEKWLTVFNRWLILQNTSYYLFHRVMNMPSWN